MVVEICGHVVFGEDDEVGCLLPVGHEGFCYNIKGDIWNDIEVVRLNFKNQKKFRYKIDGKILEDWQIQIMESLDNLDLFIEDEESEIDLAQQIFRNYEEAFKYYWTENVSNY